MGVRKGCGAGADELVVVIGYEGAQIVERFGDAFAGTPITSVHQRERRGLGHAVLQAEPYVEGDVLVVNGDNVFAGSLEVAVERVGDGVDGVLAVEEESREEATETGVIVVEEGAVQRIIEKPTDPPLRLVTTGCYVLPEDVFEAYRLARPSAEDEIRLSEAVGLLARAGSDLSTVRVGERVNVNRPADVERAGEVVREE